MILGAIPGATPDKWVARWRARYPEHPLQVQYFDCDDPQGTAQWERLQAGTVDVAYIRLPEDAADINKDRYHGVFLYREEPVVCAAADHWIAAAESSVAAAEIAEEPRIELADMLPSGAAPTGHTPLAGADLARAERLALETAAAGAGVVILPASVARMLARKDVVIRAIEDRPGYRTGLAWLIDNDSELIQEFIGIARGRKADSGRSAVPSTDRTPKRTSRRGKQGKAGGAGRGSGQNAAPARRRKSGTSSARPGKGARRRRG